MTKTIPKLRFPEFSDELSEKEVGEFAPLQRGFDLPASQIVEGQYPVVFSNGILKFHNEYKVNAPGVITGRSGTIGNVTYVEDNYWPHNTALWVTDFCNNVPRYVYYFYEQLRLQKFAAGSGVPTLNRNDVHQQIVYVPSHKEQEKIATFLSRVDEKIKQLTRKKKLLLKYKQGLMQQIFDQNVRFKRNDSNDFPDWEEKKLGDIATFSKGSGISKEDTDPNGLYECIRYGELYTHYGETIDKVVSRTNLDESELVFSKENDVIIPSSGETNIDIARAASVLRKGIALGGDITIIRSNLNGVFLSYYLNSKKRHDIARLAQGVSVVHLYPNQLASLRIEIPAAEEQRLIADFLASVDKKIALTSRQMEWLKTFKEGLLQQMFV